MGIKKGASALWYSEFSLHQLGSRPTTPMDNTTAVVLVVVKLAQVRRSKYLTIFDYISDLVRNYPGIDLLFQLFLYQQHVLSRNWTRGVTVAVLVVSANWVC